MSELKPCPFCGNSASPNAGGNNTWVECDTCGAASESTSRRSIESDEFEIEAIKKWNTRAPQSEWISVDDIKLLDLPFESEEDPNDDGYPQFDGMVSQTVEITDGESRSFGHYRSDGVWNVYIADHSLDFLNVNPKNITHYKILNKLPLPPKATQND